jgi:hypothetical protein
VDGGAAGLAGRSRGVVLVVDGAGGAGAELVAGLLPAKELEYVFKRRPCTSRSALQAYANNVVYHYIPYNQVYPEFRGSNHRENVP